MDSRLTAVDAEAMHHQPITDQMSRETICILPPHPGPSRAMILSEPVRDVRRDPNLQHDYRWRSSDGRWRCLSCHMPTAAAFYCVASALRALQTGRRTSRSSRGDLAVAEPCIECHEANVEHLMVCKTIARPASPLQWVCSRIRWPN